MSFSTTEKDALKQVFIAQGFIRFDSGKYIFKSNRKANSINSFFKFLQIPNSLEAPELKNIRMEHKANEINFVGWDELIKEWSEQNKKEEIILNTVETSEEEEAEAEDASAYIQSLVPVINVTKGAKDQLILLDPHNDNYPALDIDPEAFLTLTERNVVAMITDKSVKKVMTTFDPYTLKSIFVKRSKAGTLKTWHVNYYVPPRWRFVDAPPAYEGFIKKLMEHLFPNDKEREYVLDWLHYAIIYRNDTVLCLIGPRGTGKGILLKDILSQLIGIEYRELVNQEILTDKFNAAFKNKRYIFFDEVNVSGDRELNKFKAFCNNTIALEEKGQDSETIENYTSLALSSNDKKDFRAEPQERRFSVPEVTDVPLLKIFSETEIESFCERIADPDSKELAAFGNFLIHRKPKSSSRQPLKGKYYFELCKLSMPEWKTFIIDTILHEGIIGEPIRPSVIAKKFKKIHGDQAYFATKRGTIETFLGDYFHEGVYRIGKVEDAWDDQRGRDTFAIFPSEEFLRKYGSQYKENPEENITEENALDAL